VQVTAPVHTTSEHGSVPLVDAAATHDPETGASAVFLVNRSRTDEAVVTIHASHLLTGPGSCHATGIHDSDVTAVNDLADPERVGLVPNESISTDGATVRITLPPVSWTAVDISRPPA